MAKWSLLTPGRLGRYTLANRVLMAPLTRNRAGSGNAPTEQNATYYRQRSSAGLIITEASQVSAEGTGYPNTPGIHTSRQIDGWRRVTEAVHAEGGHIFLQLWHVGRISHPSLHGGAIPVAPSAIRPEGNAFTHEGLKPFVEPRALQSDEISGVITQFRQGAVNALEAGFDGVEIHAANGYLLDQFLRDGSNCRSDSYGGTVDRRMRLLLEVTETVAGVWGSDRVGIRLSPLSSFNSMYDSHPQTTFNRVAERLSDLSLAYLHVVGQNDFAGQPEAFDLAELRSAFDGPLVANGGYDLTSGQRAISSGAADFVAYGRLFIANPDLPERFRIDAPLNIPDPSTFYGGDERGYTDYPALGEAAGRPLVMA